MSLVPARSRSLVAPALLALLLGGAGCSNPAAPEQSEAGLFDESALLPALSAEGANAWQWLDGDGMRCRDGSRTGFGLRRAPGSPELLIYLQGGGACYDFLSCLLNPSRFGGNDFARFVSQQGQAGAFDRSRPENPFRDWNVIFVPYCTGDVHSGNAPNTFILGLFQLQDFVGYRNMEAMLSRIDGEASRARQVVLAGGSAGGFGTVGTYGLTAERLAPAPVDFLDDSGPVPPDDGVLAPGTQRRWRNTWDLDEALPPGCADCSLPNGDGLENVLPYYAAQNPARTFGLLSYREDAVIRAFFGLADPGCGSGGSCSVSGPAFEDALFGIRPTLPSNAGTYYVEGEAHTFLLDPAFYTATVDGIPLTSWAAALVAGQATDVPAVQPPLALGRVRQSMLDPVHRRRHVERAEVALGRLLVARRHRPPLLESAPQLLYPVPLAVGPPVVGRSVVGRSVVGRSVVGRSVVGHGRVRPVGRDDGLGSGDPDPRPPRGRRVPPVADDPAHAAEPDHGDQERVGHAELRAVPRQQPERERPAPAVTGDDGLRAEAAPAAPERYVSERYVSERYVSERYVSERYVSERYVSERYVSERYVSERYVSEGAVASGAPFFAPAALGWARTTVPSSMTAARSACPVSRRCSKARSQTPERDQRLWSWAARHQGPNSAGTARQGGPFLRRQTTPSTVARSSRTGRPRPERAWSRAALRAALRAAHSGSVRSGMAGGAGAGATSRRTDLSHTA